jgi:predicted metal-binding membrane protein
MPATSTLERLLRRDRLVVITALLLVIVACWAYVLAGAGMDMAPLETTPMPGAPGMAETDDALPGVMPGMRQSDMPEMDMPGMGDIPGA